MTFKEAYAIAHRESEIFRKHEDNVWSAKLHKVPSACMSFSIGQQAFYFGFDGVDIHKGVHSSKRSKQLISRGETLVIR